MNQAAFLGSWGFGLGLFAAVAAICAGACGQSSEGLELGYQRQAQVAAGDVVVNPDERRQRITGLGAAAVFWGQNLSDELAEFFFSPTEGLGISSLRVSVAQDGSCPELVTAQKATAYGVKVWAASWTPPPQWKTNMATSARPDARLMPQHYGDFANHLANYAEGLEAAGVPLYGISPQNEPDYESEWDGCRWSPQEMTTFIGQHLGPTLQSRGLQTRIIAPDTAGIGAVPGYVDALFADSAAFEHIDVIATHPYGGGALDYSKPRDNGKEYWETEVSQENGGGDSPNPTIDSALQMVRMMHDHLTIAQMNAWHWWALVHPGVFDQGTDFTRQNPALVQAGVKFKRAFAFGNYSKFVRPGFERIEATPDPASGIYVSAYADDYGNYAIVAINDGGGSHEQTFWVQGAELGTVTPWVTSAEFDLQPQPSLTDTSDNFTFTLPGRSITTFVNWDASAQLPDDTTNAGGSPGDNQGGNGGDSGGADNGGAGGIMGDAGAMSDGGEAGEGGDVNGGAGAGGESTGGTSAEGGSGGASDTGGASTTGGTSTGGVPAGGDVSSAGAFSSGGTVVGGAPPAMPPATSAGAAGLAGAAGAPTIGAPSADNAGCSCRTAGAPVDGRQLLLLGLTGLALARRRHRARPKSGVRAC